MNKSTKANGLRGAFTMIELIFVIVILGILAAVAVPRLAGVQDDALIAAEESGIGSMRSGVQAISGKFMVGSGDVNISALQEDGTEYLVLYRRTGTNAGMLNNRPIGLSASSTTTGSAATQVATLGNDDLNFSPVLDPGSGRGSWESKADNNNTLIRGKASSSITDTNAKINTGGRWVYRPSAGSITWENTPY